jgi:hypothetical protein
VQASSETSSVSGILFGVSMGYNVYHYAGKNQDRVHHRRAPPTNLMELHVVGGTRAEAEA